MGTSSRPTINSRTTSTVQTGNLTTQAINLNRVSTTAVAAVVAMVKDISPLPPPVAKQYFSKETIDKVATASNAAEESKVEKTRVFQDSVRADNLANRINPVIKEEIAGNRALVAFIDKTAVDSGSDNTREVVSPGFALAPGTTIAQTAVAIRTAVNPASQYPIRSFADRFGSAFNPRAIINRVAVPLSPDILNTATTTIQNSQFSTDSLGGISKTRPEILALIDFVKVYNARGSFNSAGKLLSINYQMRVLRKEALRKIESQLAANTDSAPLYQQIKATNLKAAETTSNLIQFYKNNFSYLNIIKDALDIKKIPRENYNLNVYLPLEDFFTQKMTYSRESYNVFSDTKILGQLFFDLRSILENHSFSLLNETDIDRIGDVDQITYDKTYSLNRNYTFKVSNIRGKFLYQQTDFNSFGNSLPTNQDDKARLLLTLLSKELRISRGLAKPSTISTITDFYQGQAVGNPFDNLFGTLGNDIFEKPQGVNSLSSLLYIEDPSGVSVLPFEQKVVDDVQTTYAPGTKYFLDNILNLIDGKFNTKPINDYSQIFSNLTFKASSIIKDLLETTNQDNKLIPTNLFVSFVEAFLSGLNVFNSINSPSTQAVSKQVAAIAILKLCSENKDFKFLIFQYLLLVGMGKSKAKGETNIFKSLIDEVRVLQNLVSIKTDGEDVDANILTTGLTGLYPFMVKTTNDIKGKIINLIGNQPSAGDTVADLTSTDDFVNCLLSPSNSLFGDFFELCFSIDTQASGDAPNGSYLTTLTNDPNHTKVTRNNQICISGIILAIFEVFISFSTTFFDGKFLIDTSRGVKLKVAYDFPKNRFSYQLFKQQIPLTGYSLAPTVPTSLNLVTTNGSEAQTSREYVAPATSNLALYQNQITQTAGLVGSVIVRRDGTVVDNSNTIARLPANIASNVPQGSEVRTTEVTVNRPESQQTVSTAATAIQESTFVELRRSCNQIFYKIEEEDKIIQNALHIIDVIGDKLSSAVKNATNYFNSTERSEIIVSNTFTSNLGPSQIRTSQWIFDQYKNSQEPLGNFTRACGVADFKALVSMLKEPFATKNLANARTKILAVGIPNGFIEKLADRIKRTTVSTTNISEDTQTDLVYINIYKKSAEDDDIIFYPKRFIFDLSLFPRNFDNINLDGRASFERILEKYKMSDYSSFSAADVGLRELQTMYKYNIITEQQKLELIRNHCQSQYLQYYVKYFSGISFDESSFPVNEYPVPSNIELPEASQNLIKVYIQKIIGRATPEELNNTIRTILNDSSIREDIKDDLQMLSFGSTLMQPDLLKTKVLSQKKFDRVFLIPFNVDEFEINVEETARTSTGNSVVNSQRFINTTEKRIIGDNEVFYNNRETIPNALVFEDFFITIETVL